MTQDFERLPPLAGLGELTVSSTARDRLAAMVSVAREVAPGTSAIFAGPAGTGKMTAARAVAGELGAALYRVDLSRVVSRYIGETEKNLRRLFDAAQGAGAVLLFDEADDLFGRRPPRDESAAVRLLDLIFEYPSTIILELRGPGGLPVELVRRFGFLVEFAAAGLLVDDASREVRGITGVDTSYVAFVGRASRGPTDEPIPATSFAEYAATFGDRSAESPMSHTVSQFFENGGRRAVIVRVSSRRDDPATPLDDDDLSGADLETSGKGLWALRGSGFSLLCVPPLAADREIGSATRRAALALCAAEGAFFIADPPRTWTTSTEVDPSDLGVADDLSYGAVYWPRIDALDPVTGGPASFAPSGTVAGVYARTDTTRGVWKAPAGREATLVVTGPSQVLTDADQGRLNPIAVNALRAFPGMGTVVWGARTLEGADHLASEWKYVPVRRLAIFIERSIEEGLRWTVFEPNDAPLWAKVRSSVETFLMELFRRGAFAGATADGAFLVRCDATTITEADLEQGRITLVVGFAPLKPAEFVILSFRLATA